MISSRRRAVVAPLAALMLSGSALALATTAAPASAASLCSGTLVSVTDIVNNAGRVRGQLHVYWDSKKKKNCAFTQKYNTESKAYTSVFISVCYGTLPCSRIDVDSPNNVNFDYGEYYSYAGPVWTRTESAGKCIHAHGMIEDAWGEKDGHCG